MGFEDLYEREYRDAERLRPSELGRYGSAMFHITQHAGDDLFSFGDQQDRREFLQRFERHLSPKSVRDPICRMPFPNYRELASLVAFCILENHYHLIVRQFSFGGTRRLMRSVLSSYGAYFNRKYGRAPGAQLWRAPFVATKINNSRQGARTLAYVTLNHENQREHYAFSSHDYYLGKRRAAWLDTQSGLWFFGRSRDQYAKYIAGAGTDALERKIAARGNGSTRNRPRPRRGPGSHLA